MQIISQSSKYDESFNHTFCTASSEIRTGKWQGTSLPPEIMNVFLTTPYVQPHDFWYLKSDDKVLGTIGASVFSQNPEIGFIGFFEATLENEIENKTANSLLDTARNWLTQQGCKQMIGPVNWNTWFPYRFKTQYSNLDFIWEPIHPHQYVTLFENYGFSKDQSYHSQGLDNLEYFVERTQKHYNKAIEAGYTFRSIDRESFFSKDIQSLYNVSISGFADNYLYEPIDFNSFKHLYVPIADKIDLSLAFIVTASNNEDVGFFFCFEDQGYLVYKSVAVNPKYRGQGLSNAVAHICGKTALDRGIKKMITAMVKDGAQSESYGKSSNEEWRHCYQLYKYNI